MDEPMDELVSALTGILPDGDRQFGRHPNENDAQLRERVANKPGLTDDERDGRRMLFDLITKSATIEHVAAMAELERMVARGELNALEATIDETLLRVAGRPVQPEPARWRVLVGQDPEQPQGVTLERWARLDNLEGSGRAGRPWGWRAQMVYRSAQEAQLALRGLAVMKTRAAQEALEQAHQLHQLAQALPDATSGQPIDVGGGPVPGQLAGVRS